LKEKVCSLRKEKIMSTSKERQIYEDLDLVPVINASGYQTIIGGSRVSSEVQAAMETANHYFVEMKPLLQKTGVIIADILGAEAALVTPGCAAALALSTAACMAGSDTNKMEQLPDTTGIKHQILIQKKQRYHYDHVLTIFGAKLVEVGDENGTTEAQLEAAISDQIAAIHYFAPGGQQGVLPPEDVVRIAHTNNVPVIFDAASQVYPLDTMRRYPDMGADLIGYGAKYIGSCHSSGILCGRKDLVESAFNQSFIGYETNPYDTLGRSMKIDRQEVIAVVTALRQWFAMDHEARVSKHKHNSEALLADLKDIPNITVELIVDSRSLSTGVRITIDEAALGKTAVQIIEELRQGSPCVWVRGSNNNFNVAVTNLVGDDQEIVISRLKEVLKS